MGRFLRQGEPRRSRVYRWEIPTARLVPVAQQHAGMARRRAVVYRANSLQQRQDVGRSTLSGYWNMLRARHGAVSDKRYRQRDGG